MKEAEIHLPHPSSDPGSWAERKGRSGCRCTPAPLKASLCVTALWLVNSIKWESPVNCDYFLTWQNAHFIPPFEVVPISPQGGVTRSPGDQPAEQEGCRAPAVARWAALGSSRTGTRPRSDRPRGTAGAAATWAPETPGPRGCPGGGRVALGACGCPAPPSELEGREDSHVSVCGARPHRATTLLPGKRRSCKARAASSSYLRVQREGWSPYILQLLWPNTEI